MMDHRSIRKSRAPLKGASVEESFLLALNVFEKGRGGGERGGGKEGKRCKKRKKMVEEWGHDFCIHP